MPQEKMDYYTILGLLRDASVEEIKRAYHEAARRLHPDTNTLAGETEIFLQVQQAYEMLSNPKRRAQYDATLPVRDEPTTNLRHEVLYSRGNLVHLKEPQLIYAMLNLGPRQISEKMPTAPLNICLLLDRSTSMQGEKIDVVKAAAAEVMRNLRPEDIFSVVAFSDRAEVLIPAAYQADTTKLQNRIQMMQTSGATEIYAGLTAAMEEIRRSLDAKRLNHIVLLTDGQTYGDELACLQLAEEAARLNIGISGLGIGNDWNDVFLDALASRTGSNSTYISKPQDIQRMLVEKFKTLANTFAEDVILEYKPSSGIQLTYAFRLQPEGGPLRIEEHMHLGPILQDTPLSVLFEFMIEPSASQADLVTLMAGVMKVMISARPTPLPPIRINMNRSASDKPASDAPPAAILSALSRLTIYRMQERAHKEADDKDYKNASRHLKNLATQLLQQGEVALAKTAMLEAENIERLQTYTADGGKEVKYGTRALVLSGPTRSA